MDSKTTKKLTENEKKVIKKIINQGRLSDTEISKDVKISQQAVYQIRKRLEELGIIKGYTPIIDYKKIGIRILFFTGIAIQAEMWKELSENQLQEKLLNIPFLFELFRIPTSDISYIAIFGFKDIEETEGFTKNLETALAKHIKVMWSYTASVGNILTQDSLNLVYHALNKNPQNIRSSIEKLKNK